MTDMHHYISELLKGNIIMREPWFEVDDNFRAIDRESYQDYLPQLCRFIETEKEPFKLAMARLILERIVPDSPDLATAGCLLGGLNNPDKISRSLLLSHIIPLTLPEGTNLEPLKERVRQGDLLERNQALKALRSAPGVEGELFLLEVLRRTESSWDIETIADVLSGIGGMFSVPVLMARLQEGNETNGKVYRALDHITARLEMPQDIKSQFADPGFWRVTWQGSKESFVGFMNIIALMSGNGDDEEAADGIAEIFREEMQVDISPFHSYRELRLCSSGDDIFGLVTGVKDHLESRILMDVALSGTGVSESTESQAQDIYFGLVNDYLFTRLRRKIQFIDDDY